IKVVFDPYDTVFDVYHKMNEKIDEIKYGEEDNNTEQVANALTKLPRFVLRFAIWILKVMDYFGLIPQSLLDASPFHGSMIITDLGSIGIGPVYHHLYNFGTLPANVSESEREKKSQQALAINNNATALNKKTLGLFHPHESSEAHSEIIQASESIRLAAYSLYTYALQENAEEQANQYRQCRNQIAQARNYLERFWKDIENLKSNYQPQQEE
ncbi:MAG: hypothetical protein IIT74_02695, partial [Bacteroidales bacterium]|nr:hypothetical protein [Bacteroidales bacterium]